MTTSESRNQNGDHRQEILTAVNLQRLFLTFMILQGFKSQYFSVEVNFFSLDTYYILKDKANNANL